MFLRSVRIENFKCIEDSEAFSLKPVTCLVGKNEAGKSALIQALYKLNPDVAAEGSFNPLLEYPRRKWSQYKERHETNPDNVLTTEWELNEEDIKALEQLLGPKTLKDKIVTISKGYNNQRQWILKIDEQQVISNYLNDAKLYKRELNQLKGIRTVADLMSKLKANDSLSERQSKLLNTLQKNFPNGDPVSKAINHILAGNLPTFIYFAEFYKMLGKVSMEDLTKRKSEDRLEMPHRIFMALLDLVGTSPEEMNTIGKFEELKAELEAVSNRLSQEIFEYWSQNKYLEVDFDFAHARPQDPAPYNTGWVFHTRIKNKRHGVTVSYEERSAGFTWFFSFLVWFSQVKKNYGEKLIILLDDPGLSLHARAQADLLRYIKQKLSPHYQVIYTTHSPFMIDADNILNVRTVEDVVTKEEEILGTKVGDEVLATDPDTLFPLQAALGYDITQTLFVGKHNVLVEGPSDLLYLKWFSRELHEMGKECLDRRLVIVPCGGISKIGSFVRLFGSSELNVVVFTDYHKGLKSKVRSLKESKILRAGRVFSADMFVDGDEADIEDVLGRDLYITLVTECYSLDESHQLPDVKPADAPVRVLLEVGNHFKALPIEFDHYTPAVFLTENTARFRSILSNHDDVLRRFEKLFKDLNRVLLGA